MLRGFVTGSLALIALYVVVQEGPSKKLGLASNTAVAGLRRLFEPGVAGIGDHSVGSNSAGTLNPGPDASGGGGGRPPSFTSNPYGTNAVNGVNPQWAAAADYFSKN